MTVDCLDRPWRSLAIHSKPIMLLLVTTVLITTTFYITIFFLNLRTNYMDRTKFTFMYNVYQSRYYIQVGPLCWVKERRGPLQNMQLFML